MDIEILEMADTKCRFILKHSSPAKANALRRTMLTDIPKMAIDTVDFHLGPIDVDGKEFESITPLFDEIIAHRLGMVPVPTRPDGFEFNYKDECSCGGEGCPNCTVMYSLNKHGPCTVLSSDLIPLGSDNLKPCDPNIPIVELADRQSVLIYAHAVKGTARKHVKWQVANGVGYKYLPKIVIGKVNEPEAVAEACPKKVFEVAGGKLAVKEGAIYDCILCRTCEEIDAGVKLEVPAGDGLMDMDFVFKFETDGSLTAQQVLDEAVRILSEDAKDLGKKIVELAQ